MKVTRNKAVRRVHGTIATVHSTLGMWAVALVGRRTRRFVLPLAPGSARITRLLLAAAACKAPVVLDFRGLQIVDAVFEAVYPALQAA